jgi:hypothetical protein
MEGMDIVSGIHNPKISINYVFNDVCCARI